MAIMATQNRLFLITVGAASCLIIHYMRRALYSHREAAIVPEAESKPQYITQDVEDSVKPSTLNKLLDSTNWGIRETATSIIRDRALHDSATTDLLLQYVTQPDHETRDKGIRALNFMVNYSTVDRINSPGFYMAIVKSLEYSVTDYEHNKFDPEWDNWNFRDSAEKGCLLLLETMIERCGPEGIIKARFVDRWLAKEPWGDDEVEQHSNFVKLLAKRSYRLNGICQFLYQSSRGRRQLENANLIPVIEEVDDDIRMTNGEGTAGVLEVTLTTSSRRRNQTTEDEHLRRRHREAMVLNDGTTPLGRDDIFQRER